MRIKKSFSAFQSVLEIIARLGVTIPMAGLAAGAWSAGRGAPRRQPADGLRSPNGLGLPRCAPRTGAPGPNGARRQRNWAAGAQRPRIGRLLPAAGAAR